MFAQLLQDKKRLYIVIGVVVMLVVVLAAIFWPRATVVPTASNQPVTLTWWKPFYGQDTYQQIIEDFRKTPGNQNVTINVVTREYNDQYYTDLIADIARGAGPDMYTIRNDDLPAYKEFMTPIRTFNGATLVEYKNSFADLVVRDTMDKDSVYAVTSYVDNLQLYYNEQILAQSGISLPPTKWSELDRQLTKLNKRDPNAISFRQHAIALGTGGRGLDGETNVNRHQDIMPMLLFQNGGQLYDYQNNSVVFGQNKNQQDVDSGIATDTNFSIGDTSRDTPAYRSMRFYADFADVTSSRYSWNTAASNNIDAFASGQLAYLIHYSYMQNTLEQKNPRLKYGVAELPQLDLDIKKTYGFFFMDGINRSLERDSSKNLKRITAENFLYFLSQRQQQENFAAKTQLPGARKDVVAKQAAGDEVLKIFAEGSLYADNYYKPDVKATEKIWSDMMYRVQYEGQPFSDSINQAQREYQAIVSAGPKLR